MGRASAAAAASAASRGSAAAASAFVPLGQLATIEPVMGPPMIKSEMGSLTGWIYVDIDTSDVGGYVAAAKVAATPSSAIIPTHTAIDVLNFAA